MKRLGLVLVVLGLVMGALPAGADVPSFVAYSGRLTDGTGWGESSQVDLTFVLHPCGCATGGVCPNPCTDDPDEWIYVTTHKAVAVVDGYFTVNLGMCDETGDECTVNPAEATFPSNLPGQMWVEVMVGGVGLEPWQPVGSVPYALRAENAASLGLIGASNLPVAKVVDGSTLSVRRSGIPYVDYVPLELGNNGTSNTSTKSAWIRFLSTMTGPGDSSWAIGAEGNFNLTYLGDRTTPPSQGVRIITVTSQGRVGIGTNYPATHRKLHVFDADETCYLQVETGNPAKTAALNLRTGSSEWTIYMPPSSEDLRFYNGGDHVTIDGSGNVGIGTNNPKETLEVAGGIKVGNSTCSADHEGTIRYVTGSPGHFYGCRKTAGGSYDWSQLDM